MLDVPIKLQIVISEKQTKGRRIKIEMSTFSQVSGPNATDLRPKVNNALYWTNELIKNDISPLINL